MKNIWSGFCHVLHQSFNRQNMSASTWILGFTPQRQDYAQRAPDALTEAITDLADTQGEGAGDMENWDGWLKFENSLIFFEQNFHKPYEFDWGH